MSRPKKNSQKSKHKNTSTDSVQFHKENSDLPKRSLTVNTTRDYNVNSDDSDSEPPNFDYLLKLSSTGSHFLLKSEQERFNQDLDSKGQFSSYFNLDTKMLNLAFKTIPFSERHTVENVKWSQEEVCRMQKEAKENEDQFELMLQNQQPSHQHKEIKRPKSPVEKPASVKSSVCNSKAPGNEDVDKDSIQQWLDDILEK